MGKGRRQPLRASLRGRTLCDSSYNNNGRVLMRTRIVSLVVAALGVGVTQPASAADLPTKAPVYRAPAFNWAGCYAGGHVGGIWGDKDWTVRTNGANTPAGEHTADGWLGGVQAGCNYEFANRFVFGIQGDYAWANAEGSHDSAREIGVAYHSKTKSLASVTGRVGYAWDRFLGYIKGGGAWQRDEYWATTIILGTAYTARETRSGWTVGIGGEYAFTSFLSGFVEYNYYDFGTRQIGLTPQVAGLGPAFVDITATTSVVRAGINFRFGGYAAPVFARH